VNADRATEAPVLTVVLFSTMSDTDTPTEPSITLAPVFLQIENHVVVPPAALESEVMEFAVSTPAAAAPNADVLVMESVATMVLAAVVALETSAGCTPA
jgi:hypothetical protein